MAIPSHVSFASSALIRVNPRLVRLCLRSETWRRAAPAAAAVREVFFDADQPGLRR
jgi:hypothetical protein